MDTKHTSIFLAEVSRALLENAHLNKQALIVDATLGGGGHTKEFLENGTKVVAFEADPEIFEKTKKDLLSFLEQKRFDSENLVLINDNFVNLKTNLINLGFQKIDGAIFDFGISRMHYFDLGRGFSFQNASEPLDMRINKDSQNVSAADLLNALPAKELIKLFESVLTYRDTRNLVRNIVEKRKVEPIKTVSNFLDVVKKSVRGVGEKNPATESFLALRIAVNSELENIEIALPQAFELLASGAKLAAISFHSLEDKIVKNLFRDWELQEFGEVMTPKPIEPTPNEVKANPSSRSARLRIIRKL